GRVLRASHESRVTARDGEGRVPVRARRRVPRAAARLLPAASRAWLSVVDSVDEPGSRRALAIAPVETAVAELQVEVVARARRVAPPLGRDPPRPGDGDDA